ncbi:hypothetical protein EDD28_1249 [Salana multivorans]|uniref:Uncharacterized protein n=1 Tax=Salana multivorans TaxID=120377 RepID=A0A3N2DAE6_9MICO|nr:hypothetical protein [Salana multivorans]ROR96662.1 hypothetical protein EDD28_1249 [Salana multivorans]
MLIVARGRWTYDGVRELPVDIVGLDHDFWFELDRADGVAGPDDRPRQPDAPGLLYYVRFRHAGETSTPTWPDSAGYPTVEEARRAAESRVPGAIVWA